MPCISRRSLPGSWGRTPSASRAVPWRRIAWRRRLYGLRAPGKRTDIFCTTPHATPQPLRPCRRRPACTKPWVGTKPSRLMRCITPESPTRKPAISPLLSQLWKRRCYLRVRCRRWIWGGWLFGPLLPRRAWTPGSSLRPRAITGRRRWLSRRSRARNLMRLIALSGEPARCSGAGTTRPPRSISRR